MISDQSDLKRHGNSFAPRAHPGDTLRIFVRDTLSPSMCQRCEELRAAYRARVEAYNEAVLNMRGSVGDDFRLLLEAAERLRHLCVETAAMLNDHRCAAHDPSKPVS